MRTQKKKSCHCNVLLVNRELRAPLHHMQYGTIIRTISICEFLPLSAKSYYSIRG